MNAEEQERAWKDGWRPAGHPDTSHAERVFLAKHPGWLQAAWAHPDWPAFIAAREQVSKAKEGK